MMIELINKVAKRTQLRYEKEGGSLREILTEELTKAAKEERRSLTDQSKANDPKKNSIEDIIHHREDLDNNQVYDTETGETIRDL